MRYNLYEEPHFCYLCGRRLEGICSERDGMELCVSCAAVDDELSRHYWQQGDRHLVSAQTQRLLGLR